MATAASNAIKTSILTMRALGDVRPGFPSDKTADLCLIDAVLGSKSSLGDAALFPAEQNFACLIVIQFCLSDECTLTLAILRDLIGNVVTMSADEQVRRPNATDGPAITVVQYAGCFGPRLMSSRQDVGNNRSEARHTVEGDESSSLTIPIPGPYPARPEMGDVRRNRAVLVNARPKAIFDGDASSNRLTGRRMVQAATPLDIGGIRHEGDSADAADAGNGTLVGHQAHSWCQTPGSTTYAGVTSCHHFTIPDQIGAG